MESEGSETFEIAAKSIKSDVLGVPKFGRNTLIKILRESEIIYGKGHDIRPYQRYIDLKYFEVVNYAYNNARGRACIGWQTLVTQRGKRFVMDVVKQYYRDKQEQSQVQQLSLFDNVKL